MSLERFLDAQVRIYDRVVAELRAGRKTSHWMWFVFPQIAGLGRSPTSVRYAISGLDEARAYLDHPVLGARLRECAEILAGLSGLSAFDIFGGVDEHLDGVARAGVDSVVERSGVRVEVLRRERVDVDTGGDELLECFGATVQGGAGEREVPLRSARLRRVELAAEAYRGEQRHPHAALQQPLRGSVLTVRERRHEAVRVCSGVNEDVDQLELRAALARDLPGHDERERVVAALRARLEQHARDLDDVRRELPVRIGFSATNQSRYGRAK